MKKHPYEKKTKVSKGAPSGFVVSLILHAAAFFVAGLFVVFTVLPKEEPEFKAPPPVERPKMKLKKPRVKIKKSSQPKPSSRIVAKVKTAKMPEIQIPDLVGTGEGLLSGIGSGGEFMDLPDISKTSLFGGGVTTGNDLEVAFYCLNHKSDGSSNSMMSHQEYFNILRNFVKDGWNTRDFLGYYKSPQKLYATTIFIPIVTACLAPVAFGESHEMDANWVAYYRGQLVHKEGITFRFWAAGDNVLTVALNKEVVVAANHPWREIDAWTIAQEWWGNEAPGSRTINGDDGQYRMSDGYCVGSQWITLEPGVPMDFDAIVGKGGSGEAYFQLLVEVKGKHYELNSIGQPLWEVFAMAPLSWEQQDAILMNMFADDANVTNVTTIFSDL